MSLPPLWAPVPIRPGHYLRAMRLIVDGTTVLELQAMSDEERGLLLVARAACTVEFDTAPLPVTAEEVARDPDAGRLGG